MKFWPALAVCATALLLAARGGDPDPVRIPAHEISASIRLLSAPDMTGRGAGTEGIEKAATWIEREFQRAGLQPVFAGSWQQTFRLVANASPGEHNRLQCTGCPTPHLSLQQDFLPMPMSATASVTVPVAFAGFGITAPECGYDDYDGLDVRGRAVLIMRHEPQEYDASSVFDGRIYTEHAQTLRKLINARRQGAAAVILMQDSHQHGANGDDLEPFSPLPGPGGIGIPILQLRTSVVAKWFEATGRDLAALQRQIDETLSPQSFLFPDEFRLQIRTDVQSREVHAANVGGYLPGETSEYVIVGAHYDHLGLGEQYSLAADMAGTVHPGADDNASGTAGVVSLARWFAARPKMRRGVLFLAFAGEEIGLLGSTHYAANPALPLDNAVSMLNMDMIGRLRDRKLTVGGVASGEGLRGILEQLGRAYAMELQMDEQAVYGSSDHTVFRARGMPVLFFFTGLHEDYHRPTDTADKIDGKSTARVVEIAGAAARVLAQSASRVPVVLPREKNKNALTASGAGR